MGLEFLKSAGTAGFRQAMIIVGRIMETGYELMHSLFY